MKYLTEQHYNCMMLLLSGVSVSKTAEQVDISSRQIYRWLAEPLFQNEMNKLVINNVKHRMSEVIDAMIRAAIEDRNAAAAKICLEASGMLKGPDKRVSVNVNSSASEVDIEAIKAELQGM